MHHDVSSAEHMRGCLQQGMFQSYAENDGAEQIQTTKVRRLKIAPWQDDVAKSLVMSMAFRLRTTRLAPRKAQHPSACSAFSPHGAATTQLVRLCLRPAPCTNGTCAAAVSKEEAAVDAEHDSCCRSCPAWRAMWRCTQLCWRRHAPSFCAATVMAAAAPSAAASSAPSAPSRVSAFCRCRPRGVRRHAAAAAQHSSHRLTVLALPRSQLSETC